MSETTLARGHVYILTSCRRIDLLYGSTLVFDSLRRGFPSARVTVVDNGSIEEGREEIRRRAKDAGCLFVSSRSAVEHGAFLEETLAAHRDDDSPLVFLDPDVVFWESVEAWSFPRETLLAGRYVPTLARHGAIEIPRLHSSFLVIPSPRRLWRRLEELSSVVWDFHPFRAASYVEKGRLRHVDTGAALYSLLSETDPAACSSFEERHLAAYEHLSCGTSIDLAEKCLSPKALGELQRAHALARSDVGKLRGLWRDQERSWKESEREAAALLRGEPALLELTEKEALLKWTKGNEDAARFLYLVAKGSQEADDLVDLDGLSPFSRSEVVTRLLSRSFSLEENAFYRDNFERLQPILKLSLVLYDASNDWSFSAKKETRLFGFVNREAAELVVLAVAELVGGFAHARRVAREMHDYFHARRDSETYEGWEAGLQSVAGARSPSAAGARRPS